MKSTLQYSRHNYQQLKRKIFCSSLYYEIKNVQQFHFNLFLIILILSVLFGTHDDVIGMRAQFVCVCVVNKMLLNNENLVMQTRLISKVFCFAAIAVAVIVDVDDTFEYIC